MCVQSGSLKPTWGFFKGKTNKYTKKTKNQKKHKTTKKAVAYILYDSGGFSLCWWWGVHVSFFSWKLCSTLGKVAKSLLFGFCFGKLVGKWHFKRSLFFLKKLSWESNSSLFQPMKLSEYPRNFCFLKGSTPGHHERCVQGREFAHFLHLVELWAVILLWLSV